MNLLLFIIILIISVVVVKVGCIAFELTGVNGTQAVFQAISCFTGTGFTTREAELIASDPQRRRIASVLMVLGKAGFVTLLATFANSLTTNDLYIPYLHGYVPESVETLVKVAIVVLVVIIIYKVVTHTKFSTSFSEMLKKRIVNREFIRPVSCNELLVATGGYGVSSVKVFKDSSLENMALHDTQLKAHDIIVLALERDGKITTNPAGQTKIVVGDKLICFGKLDTIRDEIAGNQSQGDLPAEDSC